MLPWKAPVLPCPGKGRPHRHRPRKTFEQRHNSQYQAKPVLCFHLQYSRRADRGGHPLSQLWYSAQPDDCCGGYEPFLRFRGRQCPQAEESKDIGQSEIITGVEG